MSEPTMDLTRLSVNMNQETADALLSFMSDKGITATEAVRRAISVHYFLWNEQNAGRDIIITDAFRKELHHIVLN